MFDVEVVRRDNRVDTWENAEVDFSEDENGTCYVMVTSENTAGSDLPYPHRESYTFSEIYQLTIRTESWTAATVFLEV